MSSADNNYERLLYTADVGGTNTTVGLVGIRDNTYHIIDKRAFRTQAISGVEEAITKTQGDMADIVNGQEVAGCCISCAGPVSSNICVLSNADWDIDGHNVQKVTGLRTLLVNDFIAISYSLPLLDRNNPAQLTPLPHPDGSLPKPASDPHGLTVRAVLGAGTGLGVGYLVEDKGRFFGLPSEGGHADYAPFDEESEQFRTYLGKRIGDVPGTELFVSGQGIAHIWEFFRSNGRIPDASAKSDASLAQIEAAAPLDRPSLISAAAQNIEVCADIMRFFVRMYAKYASNLALIFLPQGGFYLAGGIAAKNERWFLEDNLFMNYFVRNYKDSVRPVLDTVPVYIIKEYSISLLGAANAFASRAGRDSHG